VQIAVPSRSELQDYVTVEKVIGRRIDEMNARHGVPGAPPPVVFHRAALRLDSLVALYRLADFCIVSSLHDGMNLVAKEFVAARDDEDGVLVLSELAGAAQELTDALVINPYDIQGFVRALEQALTIPEADRRRRMRAMRQIVAGRDVFLWASDILDGLETLWTSPLQQTVQHWEEMAV
jgi:trehalose-6-phosphate synthase